MKGNPKLLAQGKKSSQAILRFLLAHSFSTKDILQAASNLSKNAIWAQLKKLQQQGLIYYFEHSTTFHGKIKIYGISLHGVHHITPENEVPSDRKRFEASHFRVANFEHQLDIQRLHLWAIKAGYTFYSGKDFYQDTKAGDKRADAVIEIGNQRIAVEVERNPKTKKRYAEILINYFRELGKETFHKVWYIMPDEKTKSSIERVIKSISMLKVKNGISINHVSLNENHWAYFEFKVHPFYFIDSQKD